MWRIIACVGGATVVNDVLAELKNLEYWGYDSAGVALHEGHDLIVSRHVGSALFWRLAEEDAHV